MLHAEGRFAIGSSAHSEFIGGQFTQESLLENRSFGAMAAGATCLTSAWQIVIPLVLIAMLSVMGYLSSRRASVLFLLDNASIEISKGSFPEPSSRCIRALTNLLSLRSSP